MERWGGLRIARFLALVLLAYPAVRLGAQCSDGSAPPCRTAAGRTPPPNSVAVLYLENLSPDTTDAYLAQGLTEEITDRLGDIERLEVASRTAVRRSQHTLGGGVAALGVALGVRFLVEGSVRHAGTTVRVSIRLVRASDGYRVWGSQYERPAADLLALEEDIARQVTVSIAGRLVPADRQALALRPTRNAQAYDRFLRGNYYLSQGTKRALAMAIAEYETAVRLDPRFAAAEARIGLAYWAHVLWGWDPPDVPAESTYARALAAANHAIALDSTSSDGWTVRGIVLFNRDRAYGAGREAFERAIALDRRNADAYEQYGSVLRFIGEDSAAVAALQTALALDPERPFTLLMLADVRRVHRRIAESRRLLDSAIAMAPSFSYPYAMRALDELWLQDTAQARQDAETAIRLAPPGYTGGAIALALIDLRAGDTSGVRARVERMLRESSGVDSLRGFNTMFVSMALAALGERDQALQVLEAVRGSPLFWFWSRWPQFDALRTDSRFERLVAESKPR